ncbi:RNA polymerase I specific transcription initiation factor Rrn7 [Diplocarpon rosae]|nr:RNA polymerase I specific transcription initiation factor Rrn7 [Diplocarpon rosae]
MSSHIDFQRFRRDESCSEEGCRARKFYIEDGKKFCQRGHEQEGFTQTQQDEDDWNAQGKKSRKRRDEKERVETVLSGNAAKELYLQCYQLILWKQCHWLVATLGLPDELRVTVRDLWELRIRVLHIPRSDTNGYGAGTGTMMFSSASEGENVGTDGTGSKRSRKGAVSDEKLPRLIETLGICYLGMLLLKLPVSLGQVYRWAAEGQIIFSRAIKHVPREMRSKLPAHYHSALEIRAPLNGVALYGIVLKLVEFYSVEFDMDFPTLNTPLLTYRYMRDLSLPVEIYPAVRRLANMLEIDFSYTVRKRKTNAVNAHPEMQLVSLIVIATKLAYPFDQIDRIPESYSDPTAVRIDWGKWMRATARESSKGLVIGEEAKVQDSDVWNMNSDKLDDYMDWYQKTWIDDRDPKISEQILQLFPLDDIPRKDAQENPESERRLAILKDVQKSLLWRNPQPCSEDEGSEQVPRAGELYKRYRTEVELPKPAKAFFELAGKSFSFLKRALLTSESVKGWNIFENSTEICLPTRNSVGKLEA